MSDLIRHGRYYHSPNDVEICHGCLRAERDSLREENERLRAGLEAVIAYVPEGFVSPMDDEDSMNYRAIAQAALQGREPNR